MKLRDIESFSEMYGADAHGCAFLFQYPGTTASNDYFPNDTGRFPRHNIGGGQGKNETDYRRLTLQPWRQIMTVGDDVMCFTIASVRQELMAYWQKHFGFNYQNVRTLDPRTYVDDINDGALRVIVPYPYERIRDDHHAVDPEVHYALNSKLILTDPEIHLPVPEWELINLDTYVSDENLIPLSVPFVIKTTHGDGAVAQIIVKNEKNMQKARDFMECYRRDMGVTQFICQRYIADMKNMWGLHIYISRSGEVDYLGKVNIETDRDGTRPIQGVVQYDDTIESEFESIAHNFGSYLAKKGYFGIASIQVIVDSQDNFYCIDGNVRYPGSSPSIMLRKKLTAQGKGVVNFSYYYKFKDDLQGTLAHFREQLSNYNFVICSAVVRDGTTHIEGMTTGENLNDLARNTELLKQKGLYITTD